MDFSATKTELNTTLGDSGDVTFTDTEKIRALRKAWNDSYVVKTVWDTSQTFAIGTYQYALPATMTTVKDIYISAGNSLSTDTPSKIDSNLWEVVNGNIQFKNNANGIIPSGYTLYIKGNHKYAYATDTLPTTNLQEYVIALAAVNTLTLLGYKKANLFLKNDLTMGELITMKENFAQDVSVLRAKLSREFESI